MSPNSARPPVRHDSGPIDRTGSPALYFYATFPETPPQAVVGLLHGYADYGGRYAHVADRWAERGVATVAIDMRGHGRAEGRRGYCGAFEEYVEDASVLARLVTERAASLPAFLFGHSFGGLVATSFALSNQHPWRGLMLSAPYFALAMKIPVVKQVAGRLASRFFSTLSLPSGLHGADMTHDAVRARAYDDDPLVFETANVRWFTEAEGAQTRALAGAPSLLLPLYVVMGTQDRVADLAGARAFVNAVGSNDKTLDVREGFFHESCSEPEWRAVADALADWTLAHVR